jgi:uncharacterized membrane protein
MLDYLGGSCSVCGTTLKVEIHHKDPKAKKFSLTTWWARSWDKIIDELDKRVTKKILIIMFLIILVLISIIFVFF